ncbi:MAG: hypothetical protein ACRDK7_06720 [Solirubrobacteraceae bacterium]
MPPINGCGRETLQPRPLGQLIEIAVAIPATDACLRVHNDDLGGTIRALRNARRLTIEGRRGAMHAGGDPDRRRGCRPPPRFSLSPH